MVTDPYSLHYRKGDPDSIDKINEHLKTEQDLEGDVKAEEVLIVEEVKDIRAAAEKLHDARVLMQAAIQSHEKNKPSGAIQDTDEGREIRGIFNQVSVPLREAIPFMDAFITKEKQILVRANHLKGSGYDEVKVSFAKKYIIAMGTSDIGKAQQLKDYITNMLTRELSFINFNNAEKFHIAYEAMEKHERALGQLSTDAVRLEKDCKKILRVVSKITHKSLLSRLFGRKKKSKLDNVAT